ncbi:acyl-CoA dehydrogenase family protein [Amycolatopsis sp. 195334CR]|uniref:acyl-CoA dehydrogenase family protein n=1 Tax=Amycolatopsis sp. 195334CR TaxID=2814588 RepID=UPI001A900BB9|nr:acyl-CoA dehydrogenase family protein [Amycolatopsis sp. 195334CR]MBN6041461.1 acyl-CoA/acyl-ACP dehydrogenase [Amycolatopsis sp. 195334CR]
MDFTPGAHEAAVTELAAQILRGEADSWPALAKSGLLALSLPADLGGDGLGVAEVCALLTEIGRAAADVPALPALALGALPLDAFGTPEQRAAFLPGVGDGTEVLTAALHEPSAPFPSRPSTTASQANGGWLLNGMKTAVPRAAEATRILVPASLPVGTGVFLVDPKAPGVTVEESYHSGGTPEHRLTFAEVPLDERNLLGGTLDGVHRFAIAGTLATLDGLLAGALELTTQHIGERVQFGRPLAAFQAVAQQIADVYIASRTVHLSTTSAIWRLATGRDADEELDVAAYWATEQVPLAMGICHHLHGGLGVDTSYPMHRYSAAAKDLVRFLGGHAHRLGELAGRA